MDHVCPVLDKHLAYLPGLQPDQICGLCRHSDGTQYPISNITIDWDLIGYAKHEEVIVRDLFAEKDIGTATKSLTLPVDIHDVRMVRLSPKKSEEEHSAWRPWHVNRLGAYHHHHEEREE